MDNEFINLKSEIHKINSRVKEYLWKKQCIFKVRKK